MRWFYKAIIPPAFPGSYSLAAAGILLLIILSACEKPLQMKWAHFYIADPLPGSGWGTGSIALADFDRDGDLDIALSRRETLTAYWFERKNDSTWVRHEMGSTENLARALGAEALDVDRDGLVDAVINNVWFKNPGNLADSPDAPWPINEYAGGGHDVIAADVDGDGFDDLITYNGDVVYWFDNNNGLERITVGAGEANHGGIAPEGAGDLNNDGRLDIVIPGYWFENPGKGRETWQRHSWPHEPYLGR